MGLAAVLDLLAPALPEILFPGRDVEQVREKIAALPAEMAALLGFECPLGRGGERGFAFSLSDDGMAFLAGGGAGGRRWCGIRDLCTDWPAVASKLPPGAGGVWLEFDLDREAQGSREPEASVPNVFFPLPGPGSGFPRKEALDLLCGKLLPKLSGGPIDESLRQRLAECFEACPDEVDRWQIGVMLSRTFHGVRWCSFGIPPARVMSVLHHLGAEPPRDLPRLLDTYAPLVDSLCLHLNVGREILPGLGVELLFDKTPWRRQPELEPRWHNLLDRLVADGFCTLEEQEALLSWPGYTQDTLSTLRRALARLAETPSTEAPAGVTVRGLAHVKLSTYGQGSIRAKAYFGAHHRS